MVQPEEVAGGMGGELEERHLVCLSAFEAGFGFRVEAYDFLFREFLHSFKGIVDCIHEHNRAVVGGNRQRCELILGDAYYSFILFHVSIIEDSVP